MAGRDGTLLSPAQRVAWLRLIRTENVGPQTFRQLVNREGSADAALAALPDINQRLGRPSRIPSVSEAEDEIAGLDRLGGRLVGSGEPDYPPLLRHISGAPPLLPAVSMPAVSVPSPSAVNANVVPVRLSFCATIAIP